MKRRRCLVPADGFYEWKAVGPGKQPYYVRAKSGAPLAFAGLWETWIGPNSEEMETATIVTTRVNGDAPASFLVGSFDGYTGWLVAGWAAILIAVAWSRGWLRPAS